MKKNKDKIVPMSEASGDFSRIAQMTDDEKIDFVAERILREYRSAFEELAK